MRFLLTRSRTQSLEMDIYFELLVRMSCVQYGTRQLS